MGAESSTLADTGGGTAAIEPKLFRSVFTSCSEARTRLEHPEVVFADCGANFFGTEDDKTRSPRSTTIVIPFLDTVSAGDLEEVKAELKKDPGVLQRARDNKGNVATHYAAAAGHVNVLDALAKIEPEMLWAKNEVNNTPAHKAAEAGRVAVLAYLKDRDPSLLSSRGALGATPLHLAATKGHIEAVLFLAQDDPALLAARDRRGSTAAHYAATHGRVDVLSLAATRRPALLSDPNDQGDTPAHLAAGNGKIEALRFLVERDPAVVHAENAYGRRPSEVAAPDGACRRFLESAEAYTVAQDPPVARPARSPA